MKIPASKLRDARLAAAEAFIGDGLSDTNWEFAPERLRDVAENTMPYARYHAGKGWVDVDLVELRGSVRVVVATRRLGRMSPEQAEVAARALQRATEVARKVEAAMEEAAK